MRNQSIRTSFSTCYQDSSQLTSFTNNRAFNKKVVLTENVKNSEKTINRFNLKLQKNLLNFLKIKTSFNSILKIQ